VLKRMGAGGTGISFGMPGYTLALDFPISDDALKLIAELEQIAIDHGGRFYLAKDACLSALCAKQADPRLVAFAERRSNDGTALHFASLQSRRLEL
jgi:decaprenylphospho-beta-D-ribofuranose 2-oxidase